MEHYILKTESKGIYALSDDPILVASFPGALTLTGADAMAGTTSPVFSWDLKNPKYDGFNAIQVMFAGVGADNTQFDFELVAYKDQGPAMVVCSTAALACYLGTQMLSATSRWCDTITLTINNKVFRPRVLDSANNRICVVEFDMKGYRWLQCNLIDNTATVTSIIPYMTGY